MISFGFSSFIAGHPLFLGSRQSCALTTQSSVCMLSHWCLVPRLCSRRPNTVVPVATLYRHDYLDVMAQLGRTSIPQHLAAFKQELSLPPGERSAGSLTLLAKLL